MKRITPTLIAFLFLVANNLSSQPVTVVSGRIENIQSYNNYTKLTIKSYSHETFEARDINHDGWINTDLGTFRFETNDVILPYQMCWLQLGNKSIHILLSPGDTLYIKFDYNNIETTLDFTGKGAGINYYRKDYNLEFWKTNIHQNIRNIKDPGRFQEQIMLLQNTKQQLLDSCFRENLVDTNYYIYESTRIKYSIISEVLLHFKNNTNSYTGTDHFILIDSLLEYIDVNDPKLLEMEDYRNAIFNLIYYKAVLQNDKNKALILDQIDCAGKYLKGEVRRSVLKRKFEEYYYQSNNKIELNVVVKNLRSKIDDPLIDQVLSLRVYGGYKRWDTDLSAVAFVTALIILGFLLVIWLLGKIGLKSVFQGVRFDFLRALIIVFYILAFIFINVYLEDLPSRNGRIFAFHFLYMIIVYVLHTFYIIPKFFYSPKRIYYYISLSIMLVLAIALAQFTRHLAIQRALSWDNEFEVSVFAQTWLAVTLVISWLGFFIHKASRKGMSFGKVLKERKVSTEIVILIFVLLITNLIFSANVDSQADLSVILTFYSAIAIFLLQIFWLIPKILFKKQYQRFVIYNIALLLVLCVGMYIVAVIQSVVTFHFNDLDYKISDLLYLEDVIASDKLISAVFIIVPAVFYNYIKYLIKERETEGFRLYRNKEAELIHLRSQVNPHFLFNNLNTLYSFALKEKSDKTAESIAKLANLMRYMIDDMDKERIPLKKEVAYIEDYIKLQSIRSSVEHNIEINVDIDCEDECTIAPMLLIPFVENAFKHGINPNKKSELLIDVRGRKDEIQFVIENNVDREFESFYKEKGFGIGIENVKRRLGYIYPNLHNISIAETDNRFIVIISIRQKPANFVIS